MTSPHPADDRLTDREMAELLGAPDDGTPLARATTTIPDDHPGPGA